MKLRVGTRGSQLALTQARSVGRALERHGHQIEIVIVKTRGDADQVRPFAEVGEPGLFVREIERALLEEEIDVAVHSYKDLPSVSPEELSIAAVPERVDPRDRLIVREEFFDSDASGLPLVPNAVVGTASARRQALVRHLRPDLELELLRGNVPTRVKKLRAAEFDAILLASAGLSRLDRAAERGEVEPLPRAGLVEFDLEPEIFVPAPSQGALALQVRKADSPVLEAIQALDDASARRTVTAERSLLALVDAGCQVPFGAFCRELENGDLALRAVLEVDREVRSAHVVGDDPDQLAAATFQFLLPEGESVP
jgi:hydroxymethylbilane synthase